VAFVDTFGRVHDDLRLSITDRCNLRCAYCMPHDPVWYPHEAILSFEEITRVARIAVAEGVAKLRVTGGEPLVRRDVATLIGSLANLPGLTDLSLTTNGVLLEPLAADLARAGLRRVNVSLDTLDRDRFSRLTGRDRLPDVLRGLAAADAAGIGPIKINAVLLRGENEHEAVELARFGRDHGYEVRFIEFMPLENDRSWDPGRVVRGSEVRRAIGEVWPIVRDPAGDPHAPATRFLFEDGSGAVGFIDSVSSPFCSTCSRIRLTSDGKFRVCLYDDLEADLREALRGGATDERIVALMREALARKGRGGALDILESRTAIPLARTMHQIGG
jgi:cyclic pyranopterin phosphate synthase